MALHFSKQASATAATPFTIQYFATSKQNFQQFNPWSFLCFSSSTDFNWMISRYLICHKSCKNLVFITHNYNCPNRGILVQNLVVSRFVASQLELKLIGGGLQKVYSNKNFRLYTSTTKFANTRAQRVDTVGAHWQHSTFSSKANHQWTSIQWTCQVMCA